MTKWSGNSEATDGRDLDPEAVLLRSDAALYQAKQTGRNRVVGLDA